MKQLVFLWIAFIGILSMSSCEKDLGLNTDSDLINQIEAAAKTTVAPEDMPDQAEQTIDNAYFETYVDEALYAKGLGYKVNFANSDAAYFDESGDWLDEGSGMKKGPKKGHGPKGPKGPKGGGCGDTIAIADLPQSVLDYISENYSDAEIKRAKQRENGDFWVGLDDHTVLIFDTDGNFIEEAELTHGPKGHKKGTVIDVADLPQSVTDYLAENYPGVEIKKAILKDDGEYVVKLLDGETRIVAVFDADGNFLFEHQKD